MKQDMVLNDSGNKYRLILNLFSTFFQFFPFFTRELPEPEPAISWFLKMPVPVPVPEKHAGFPVPVPGTRFTPK